MQSWDEIVHDFSLNWPIYVSMPFVAALIGWFTKLVAIKMMFRPHKFKGIGPLGWQGIIPKRSPQMIDVLCNTLTGKLISTDAIVERIDGAELAERIERPLNRVIAQIVPSVAKEYQSAAWSILPGPARDMVVQRAKAMAPVVVIEFVDRLRRDIDDVFDLRDMVTKEFASDPDILESMFLDVGRREFAFIRRSGLVFGFMIGLVQVAVWALLHNPWAMPIFGLFTGWFTDWAALRLIFNPKEPKKYLGVITWQGLFLKHRIPVSEEYGTLIATRVLTSDRLVASVFHGPSRQKITDMLATVLEEVLADELVDINRHIKKTPGVSMVDPTGGLIGALTGALTAPARAIAGAGLQLAEAGPMSRAAAADLVEQFPAILESATDLLDEQMGILDTMAEKMVAMTPEQFEGVLRPAFQADERTIIMIGAALGFMVGELQVFLVEHFSQH